MSKIDSRQSQRDQTLKVDRVKKDQNQKVDRVKKSKRSKQIESKRSIIDSIQNRRDYIQIEDRVKEI